MKIKDFDSLFVHQVKDLLGAEKQLAKILPKMAKKASNDDLREVFESHTEETKHQIERLEKVLGELEISPRGAKCPGMEGIVEEAKEFLEGQGKSDTLDAAMICAAQRAEHYEIAGYGCLRSLAQQIGRDDLAGDFQKTLDEEHQANQRLNQIALGHVNRQAAEEGDGRQIERHNGHEHEHRQESRMEGRESRQEDTEEMREPEHAGAHSGE